MMMGVFDPHAVNFVVRDIDTGEVLEEFRTRASSYNYLRTMSWGLNCFYEVYDCRERKVVLRVEKYGNQNYSDIKEDKIKQNDKFKRSSKGIRAKANSKHN